VDEFGNTKLQWVKTDTDAERQVELMKAVIDGMKSEITPVAPVKAARAKRDECRRAGLQLDYHVLYLEAYLPGGVTELGKTVGRGFRGSGVNFINIRSQLVYCGIRTVRRRRHSVELFGSDVSTFCFYSGN
jgi:hypothetical protein